MQKFFVTFILLFSANIYTQHHSGAIPIVGVKDIANSISSFSAA